MLEVMVTRVFYIYVYIKMPTAPFILVEYNTANSDITLVAAAKLPENDSGLELSQVWATDEVTSTTSTAHLIYVTLPIVDTSHLEFTYDADITNTVHTIYFENSSVGETSTTYFIGYMHSSDPSQNSIIYSTTQLLTADGIIRVLIQVVITSSIESTISVSRSEVGTAKDPLQSAFTIELKVDLNQILNTISPVLVPIVDDPGGSSAAATGILHAISEQSIDIGAVTSYIKNRWATTYMSDNGVPGGHQVRAALIALFDQSSSPNDISDSTSAAVHLDQVKVHDWMAASQQENSLYSNVFTTVQMSELLDACKDIGWTVYDGTTHQWNISEYNSLACAVVVEDGDQDAPGVPNQDRWLFKLVQTTA